MSHAESLSVASRLHDAISAEAQRFIDGDDPVNLIHADIVELVNEYRGHLSDRVKDPHVQAQRRSYERREFPSGGTPFSRGEEVPYPDEATKDINAEKLKRLRIIRETVLAALSRVMGDIIIQKVLHYSTDDGIDMGAMIKACHPANYYSKGMTSFLDESVDEVVTVLEDRGHQYHALLRQATQIDHEYLSLVTNEAKRTGAKLNGWNNIYNTLQDMYTTNYQELTAPLMVMHGISMQNYHLELPDGEVLAAATAASRPHWLSLATMPRIAFQNIFFGEKLLAKILEEAERTGTFPTWVSSWPDGMSRAMAGTPNPFAGCPLKSPLLDRASGEVIEPFKSPGHCSGNITLAASPEANKKADEAFGLLDGEITKEGKYPPVALLIDLGRAAAKYAYSDTSFRDALIRGRRACDEAKTIS